MRRPNFRSPSPVFPNRPSRLIVGLVLLGLVATGGCVRRRLTIRSNPEGARVFVDSQEVGVTPVSTGFTYYGTRTIQLTRDGYETLTVQQKFDPPWYEYPPLDFITENLIPGEQRDERTLDFQMVPQQILPAQTIVDRAEQLRAQAGHGQVVVPAAP